MTLFPAAVDAMMQESILGRAQKKGLIEIHCHQIRDYTTNRQNQVDDYPYGGGRGAIMQCDPLFHCWSAICDEVGAPVHTIFLSPCGSVFNQEKARQLRDSFENIILVCGHYEGIDQRFIDECVDEEISVGDFVLTGGELPAMCIADAVCRLVPGVLGDEVCFTDESHWDGLLEYPQYSRPDEWHGLRVPEVLLSGNHALSTAGAKNRPSCAPCAAARTCSESSASRIRPVRRKNSSLNWRPKMNSSEIATLKTWIEASDNIVFFGGAGVSTESGIPDFRSEDGLYHQRFDHPPEQILSHSFFYRRTEYFYRFYREKMLPLEAQPNAAHRKLAALEQAGKLRAVVTQNIDGLHQKAGSRRVYELHGSVLRNYCTKCRKFYSAEFIRDSVGVPHCTCGGLIKPDVVLYEEGLDGDTIDGAIRAISDAEVLIVGGTSLTVYPAAGLLRYYRGNKLVLINRDETPYDGYAQLVFREPIGQVLSLAAADF